MSPVLARLVAISILTWYPGAQVRFDTGPGVSINPIGEKLSPMLRKNTVQSSPWNYKNVK